MPVDVSESTLREAAEQIAATYAGIRVEAIVGDFTLHLAHLPRDERKLVAFLGGTIGNLYVEERRAFLGALADSCEPGDWLLLGTDLVKDADRLIAAYDDPAASPNGSSATVCGSSTASSAPTSTSDAFTYVPFWDPHLRRMDLRLRSEMPQRVRIPGADLDLRPRQRRGDPDGDLHQVHRGVHPRGARRGRLRGRPHLDRRSAATSRSRWRASRRTDPPTTLP